MLQKTIPTQFLLVFDPRAGGLGGTGVCDQKWQTYRRPLGPNVANLDRMVAAILCLVGIVPSMVGVVPSMVGIAPSMVGIAPSMVGIVPSTVWVVPST